MSHNISSVKIKQLDGYITLSEIWKFKDWNPTLGRSDRWEENTAPFTIFFDFDMQFIGELEGHKFWIKEIYMTGEASGSFYSEVFEDLLAKSQGVFDIITIWEGGEEIWRLYSVNGKVEETQLKIEELL